MPDNPNSARLFIFDLDQNELQAQLSDWGQPAYRAKQIWQGLYQKLWTVSSDFSSLPLKLRQQLDTQYSFQHLYPERILTSTDGETTKVLFKLPDGNPVESVLMRYRERNTVCISTQSGCAMNCAFCATGQLGFFRNLSSGEIVEQVLYFARNLAKEDAKLTNVVVMGMGEPFHNFKPVLDAIDRLNDAGGVAMGERRFTISSVGLTPQIREFTHQKKQINLAISLHAANDELRSKLIPINQKYSIKELIDACKEYIDTTHRRITFEWALIHNRNDSDRDARQLVSLIKGMNCHVNIIPLNPTTAYKGIPSSKERAASFQKILEESGIPCTIRLRRGIDVNAGCGQLAGTIRMDENSPSF
jgi:23S rRNA (adenine2503-C2)-methyltransferase